MDQIIYVDDEEPNIVPDDLKLYLDRDEDFGNSEDG